MAPLSTTLPSDLSQNAAMNFSLWKTLGTEVFLQSDQVNWYICRDGSGSILHWKDGSIACRVAKSLVDKCKNVALENFEGGANYGLRLTRRFGKFYRFFYKVAVMTRREAGGMSWDSSGKKQWKWEKGRHKSQRRVVRPLVVVVLALLWCCGNYFALCKRIREILAYGIWNTLKLYLEIPDSRALESRTQLKESGILLIIG